MVRNLVVGLLLVLFATGCASQAVFLSDPPGAQVFVNGSKVGTTPCEYEYNLNSGGDYFVTLEKRGYETVNYTMASEEIDRDKRNMLLTAGAVIPGGSVLWIGALFTKGLKETYEFALKEQGPRYTAMAESKDDKN